MQLIQQSNWYNADIEEIIAAAEAQSEQHVGIGATLAKITEGGMVAVIEDDLGDIAFATPNCTELFGKSTVPREATTDYLPKHLRGFHRSLHRRAIKSLIPDGYELPVEDRRWTVELYPFQERGETFTLSLFSTGPA